MTSNGMYLNCACQLSQGELEENTQLILLSSIPNQKIYRCNNCHSFLSYTEDSQRWEVIMPGDIEQEIKSLYEVDKSNPSVA